MNELQDIIAGAYGVKVNDLATSTEYVTTGKILVTIPDSVSTEEALAALSESLASTLDIDENSIQLTIDSISGEVEYSISTNDYSETTSILDAMAEIDDLQLEPELIVITDVYPDSDIASETSVMVNGDKATPMLQQAENVIDAIIGDDYILETSSNNA